MIQLKYKFITSSWICTKWTVTEHCRTSLCLSDLCNSTDTFFDLIFEDRYPNTKSKESITLLFPLPLAPTMLVKLCKIKRHALTIAYIGILHLYTRKYYKNYYYM